MKKLSPASNFRFRPPRKPPSILASISMLSVMNIIAPASARTSSPAASDRMTACMSSPMISCCDHVTPPFAVCGSGRRLDVADCRCDSERSFRPQRRERLLPQHVGARDHADRADQQPSSAARRPSSSPAPAAIRFRTRTRHDRPAQPSAPAAPIDAGEQPQRAVLQRQHRRRGAACWRRACAGWRPRRRAGTSSWRRRQSGSGCRSSSAMPPTIEIASVTLSSTRLNRRHHLAHVDGRDVRERGTRSRWNRARAGGSSGARRMPM